MIKVIPPGSYDFGVPPVELIKSGGRGLRGHDLSTFIKRAGTQVAEAFNKLSFARGEVPVHLIALGATEAVGPNRNGDGFDEEACKKYHPTFTKYARFYRSHANSDPAKSYGIVKQSMYNDSMRRVELIVALNGTKEAADRNGGLVADKELEKLGSESSLSCSMSAKVAFDSCSGCGNKARSRAEYCLGTDEGGSCKYGGLKHNMGKVAEDGHILFADNPHPKWFDISAVFRGADRIAFVTGRMDKAASSQIVSGAQLAEELGLTEPLSVALADIDSPAIAEQVKIAHQLAAIEVGVNRELAFGKAAAFGHDPAAMGVAQIGIAAGAVQRSLALKALAMEKIALPLSGFIQFVYRRGPQQADRLAEKVAGYLPSVYADMIADTDSLVSDLQANPYRPSYYPPSGELQSWARALAPNLSLDRTHMLKRAWRCAIREDSFSRRPHEKAAGDDEAHRGIARAYGLYKIAFLYEIKDTDNDFALTQHMVVSQNCQ